MSSFAAICNTLQNPQRWPVSIHNIAVDLSQRRLAPFRDRERVKGYQETDLLPRLRRTDRRKKTHGCRHGVSGPENRAVLLWKAERLRLQAFTDPLKHFLGCRRDQHRFASNSVES